MSIISSQFVETCLLALGELIPRCLFNSRTVWRAHVAECSVDSSLLVIASNVLLDRVDYSRLVCQLIARFSGVENPVINCFHEIASNFSHRSAQIARIFSMFLRLNEIQIAPCVDSVLVSLSARFRSS